MGFRVWGLGSRVDATPGPKSQLHFIFLLHRLPIKLIIFGKHDKSAEIWSPSCTVFHWNHENRSTGKRCVLNPFHDLTWPTIHSAAPEKRWQPSTDLPNGNHPLRTQTATASCPLAALLDKGRDQFLISGVKRERARKREGEKAGANLLLVAVDETEHHQLLQGLGFRVSG